ncbi:hypothetical protein [Streptomyces megasporus]|uniref:hypothetical protein n=1 Tax=Streptomyces megasporus TaxID=44060 RepID=UPI0004E115DB|nr:hypothetical protein [Streptomyces megasporus]
MPAEIVVADGRVRPLIFPERLETPQAAMARRIANNLPFPALVEKSRIVHNRDENYTGIRVETQAGPIVFMMPVTSGFEFNVVHESETGPRLLCVMRGTSLNARQVAARFCFWLRSRGLA